MNPQLRIRRATVEDIPTLRAIWLAMQLPADRLENRLTEFQVAERGGEVLGAIGFQILRTAALLHSEGYADFSEADAARELFWERIEVLCANHGVFRLWTQENAPFWLRWGFQPADAEILERLPEEWKIPEGKWFTLELKNEDAVNQALKNQFAHFMAAEKQSAEETKARAKQLATLITIACFVFFLLCIAVCVYLVTHRH